MGLEDLVYSYPDMDATGEDFEAIIAAKEEFIELASDPREVPQVHHDNRTELLRHQELIIRYMAQYDRLLLFHGLGTGKTGAAVGVGEFFLENIPRASVSMLETYLENKHSHIRRVYVLVRGRSLRVEFTSQLVNVLTNGRFITSQVLASQTPRQLMSSMTSAISNEYKVLTYGVFIGMIYGNIEPSEEEANMGIILANISAIVNNSLIIVDEVHSLRLVMTNDSEDEEIDTTTRRERETLYRRFHFVFHTMEYCKLLLMSGTPLISEVSELKGLLNLLLPEERQISPDLDMETVSVEDLEQYTRGIVSFIRVRSPDVVVTRAGIVMENPLLSPATQTGEFILYPSTMTEFQARVYLNTPSGVFERYRQEASDFVFPDGSFGSKGFKKYIQKLTQGSYYPTRELEIWLNDPERQKAMSIKYYTIGRLIQERPGLSFVYMAAKVHGSGAIVFGLLLESLGFSRFKQIIRDPSKVRPGKRYALITSATTDEEQISVINVFNSPENIDGDLIKVIVGTRVTRDGLNLHNIRDIHFASGDWTESSNAQAEGRGLRAGKHKGLLDKLREEMEEKGLEPADAVVDVTVFRHVALVSEEEQTKFGGNPQSVDVLIYGAAEKRDISIRRVLRLMMRTAFDCPFHLKRNLVDGKDYSSECDYERCSYKCYPETELHGVLLDSYDALYKNKRVDRVARYIARTLQYNFSVTFDEVMEAFGGIPRRYVEFALVELFGGDRVLYDRFGRMQELGVVGETITIGEAPGIYGDLGLPPYNISTEIYTQMIVGRDALTLSEIFGGDDGEDASDLFYQLEGDADVRKVGENHDREAVTEALETIVAKGDKASAREKEFLAVFKNFVVKLRRNAISIDALKESFHPKRGQKGRRASPDALRKTPARVISVLPDKTGEWIYVHKLGTLFDKIDHRGRAPTTDSFVRIFDGAGVWRTGDIYEDSVYKRMMYDHLNEYIKNNTKTRVYAIVWPLSPLFPITDRRKGGESLGKVCETWNRQELLSVLLGVGVKAPRVPIPESEYQMLEALRASKVDYEGLPIETLKYYYSWISSGRSVKSICELLKDELKKRKLVVYL